jgi:hypothetical protein
MHRAGTDKLTELKHSFYQSLLVIIINRNQLQKVYVPNHTCAIISAPDLYCMMMYVLYKVAGSTQFH